METIKYNAPLTPLLDKDAEKRLVVMFKDNKDFIQHLANLKHTVRGLYRIVETRPDLMETVGPQFDTLNELIGVLLTNHDATRLYVEIK